MVEVFREHYLVKEYGLFFIFEMTNNLFFSIINERGDPVSY